MQMLEHTPEEWQEFCRWMEEGDGRECLYAWLTFKDGTFHLSAKDGKAKAEERFQLWLGRKRGLAQVQRDFKVIRGGKKTPPPKIDLKDLLK